jgi:hypothetical protein
MAVSKLHLPMRKHQHAFLGFSVPPQLAPTDALNMSWYNPAAASNKDQTPILER